MFNKNPILFHRNNENRPVQIKKIKKAPIAKTLDKSDLLPLYQNMLRARYLDQKMLNMVKQGKSSIHIGGSGHEAIQTAMAFVLKPGSDWAYPYYRDLAFVLQYGVSMKEVLLNFLGRADDPSSGGRQMPHHYGHRPLRIVTQSSPTGTQFLQAVGCALGARRANTDEVIYVSSGEGTTAQGDFHEALNWASRDQLPVIFVIQNNKYAISVPVKTQIAGGSIYQLASGYSGLNRFVVDGTDLLLSYQTARQALQIVRAKKGPALIEAHTVRLLAHSSSDSDKKYRSEQEIQKDRSHDPLIKLEKQLIQKKILNLNEIESTHEAIKNEVNLAAEEAERMPVPQKESYAQYIFSPEVQNENPLPPLREQQKEKIVLVDAINHALHEEMHRQDGMYIFGQDVADGKGGVFTATSGLSTKFGADRCFNAPLAESSIVGVAIGMAVRGLKPVVEIQFGDYIWTAMMQIRNELSTIRWRSNNTWSCPVVIRVPVGGYIHGGLCHSQNIEAFFSHIPGLKIAYPSSADDAKGLLKFAIRSDDPVLFLEHKGLYRQSYAAAAEPDENYLLPFGKARIRLEGKDATVVTYGALVQKSMEAAKILKQEGLEIEVIDIRTMVPLDMETILNSVRKTNRVLVVHEDSLFQGFGAEICARIADSGFEYLDAAVKRLAGKDTPVGFSPVLEETILPQTKDVVDAVQQLARY
jgi:2-oxoisovalerate dehydrogenase E1 component